MTNSEHSTRTREALNGAASLTAQFSANKLLHSYTLILKGLGDTYIYFSTKL
jgi:hypothetical protein